MKQLLHDLIYMPPIFGYAFMLVILSILILIPLGFKYKKNLLSKYLNWYSHYNNPYFVAVGWILFGIPVASVTLLLWMAHVNTNSKEYVTIRKENDSIVIDSHSLFIKSTKLPIEKEFDDKVIVEKEDINYNNVEYTIYKSHLTEDS